VQLTRSIAASHGRQGVRCNAVAPGMTLTPSLVAAFPAELRRVVEQETLRDRLGAPQDIAEAVAFLASTRRATSPVRCWCPTADSRATCRASTGFGSSWECQDEDRPRHRFA